MTLWLVRHAQPLIAPGVCYGASDVEADGPHTRATAHALALVLPAGLSVVSSPLQRCEQLALCLKVLRPDLIYTTDARLVELNFGCWEGVPWGAIPATAFEAWTADFWAHRFGGQESVQALMQRVAQVWDEWRSAEGSAVWITHAGVIRAATLIAQGVRQVSQAAHWPQAAPGFGQWCELAKEGGSWF